MRGKTLDNVQKCSNCGQLQVTEEGIVDFVDDLCESCFEAKEKSLIEHEDSLKYGDYE